MGKTVRYIARLRGGGSALPGLFVETIDKSLSPTLCSTSPRRRTHVAAPTAKPPQPDGGELLESWHCACLQTVTGSNFSRGVAVALLGEVDTRGRLSADIAVLELDRSACGTFCRHSSPRYSLLLNVMRDQLDRFGEIDTAAGMLEHIARATTGTVIVNREDARLRAIAAKLHKEHPLLWARCFAAGQQFPKRR